MYCLSVSLFVHFSFSLQCNEYGNFRQRAVQQYSIHSVAIYLTVFSFSLKELQPLMATAGGYVSFAILTQYLDTQSCCSFPGYSVFGNPELLLFLKYRTHYLETQSCCSFLSTVLIIWKLRAAALSLITRYLETQSCCSFLNYSVFRNTELLLFP